MTNDRIAQLKKRSDYIGANFAEWSIDHRHHLLPNCEERKNRMWKLLAKIDIEIFNIQNNTNHKVA